jgi:hypothetical protein
MKGGSKKPSTRRSDRQRIEAKVTKSGPCMPGMPTRCWEWTGAVDREGYPKFKLKGKTVTAQRALYLLTGYRLHPDQVVITTCRCRRCMRPNHLALGTREEAHALALRGDPSIGPGDLWLIRKVINEGGATVDQVSYAYGLSRELVEQILAAGSRL